MQLQNGRWNGFLLVPLFLRLRVCVYLLVSSSNNGSTTTQILAYLTGCNLTFPTTFIHVVVSSLSIIKVSFVPAGAHCIFSFARSSVVLFFEWRTYKAKSLSLLKCYEIHCEYTKMNNTLCDSNDTMLFTNCRFEVVIQSESMVMNV